jgi:hypothetical protein
MRTLIATLLSILLSACANTSTLYTKAFERPTSVITDLRVVYMHNPLVRKDKKGDIRPSGLEAYGYNDLPELLRERSKLVFSLNGISSEYATYRPDIFNLDKQISTIKWAKTKPNSVLLTIQIVDGHVYPAELITLNLNASLINVQTLRRQWTGQFKNEFRQPPFLIGKLGFDNDTVDKLLTTLLNQLKKDGFVDFPTGEALTPSTQQQ